MSLKAIELQIAIPKTYDAGRIAEQKQQQSQLNQEQAQALTEKQLLKSRDSVIQTEKSAKTDADTKEGKQDGKRAHDEKELNEEEKETVHPYKGSFVDFTG
ncbi:RNA polymerase subunit sigma [Sporosarcina sp. Sa2YVA2]|uniref:RNA polymerase subunit sigma n=1 Tax=Sporosarcina quadrami TaxID=2762234 RepID=A0ABR8U6B4_9BACL|nr:RNA polymerase subunit sigma [Sporosarcina quadrami]MBD7983555.1 RNA polymerase subunit sigma [Sporosarcina quadrami]